MTSTDRRAPFVLAGDPRANGTPSPLTVGDFLVLGFLALTPFVNVISPSTLLPLPMIAGIFLFSWLLLTRNFRLDGTYLSFIALCMVCFLPWVLSGDFISPKTLLHSIGLVSSITIYYASTRCALSALLTRRTGEDVFRILYLALLLSSAFIIVEFLGINGRIPDVTRYVPYTQRNEFSALILGILQRPRGFATEPGVMALFFDLALFAVIPLLSTRWYWRVGYYFIIVPAYLTLFSAASLVGTGAALVALTIWNFQRRFLTTSGKIGAFASAIAIAAIIGGSPLQKMVALGTTQRVAALVLGSGDDSSAIERRRRLVEVENVVYRYPLGIGFGIAAGLPDKDGKYRGIELSSGQVSLIGTFLVAGGLLAGILASAMVLFTVFRAMRIPRFGPYLAAGGFALAIHQLTVTEFWLPYFWLFFALTNAFLYPPLDGGRPTSASSA
jgi:hypothetical protein